MTRIIVPERIWRPLEQRCAGLQGADLLATTVHVMFVIDTPTTTSFKSFHNMDSIMARLQLSSAVASTKLVSFTSVSASASSMAREIGSINYMSCMVCRSPASHRCAVCEGVMYCGKACQLQHWKEHKKSCCPRFPEV